MEYYTTQNSVYVVDREAKKYRREALHEQAVESHRLEYNEWLPFVTIEREGNALHIMAPDSVYGIFTSEIVSYSREIDQA